MRPVRRCPPGQGPRRHPYVEILIVLEGTSTVDDGTSKRAVNAGEMAVVDAGQVHTFVNSGERRCARSTSICRLRFSTEWLT